MWLAATLDLLFPRRCPGCDGERPDGATLCSICEISLLPVDAFCPHCGAPTALRLEPACCGALADGSRLWSSYLYGGDLQRAIWRLKYERAMHLASPLSSLMAAHPPPWLTSADIDGVVHVPSSSAAMRRRGYNPAGLLAAALCRRSGLTHQPSALIRRPLRQTRAQMKRGADERRQAMDQSPFVVRGARAVRGRRLLVVDDVVTTAATLRSLMETLRAAGARRVDAWTLAATERRR
ncbi:MAG: ComF family protein [Myxococcales bacterium]|nr:ComF family protein [Myxococcales bacterium]